jgi:hypothetical protein
VSGLGDELFGGAKLQRPAGGEGRTLDGDRAHGPAPGHGSFRGAAAIRCSSIWGRTEPGLPRRCDGSRLASACPSDLPARTLLARNTR